MDTDERNTACCGLSRRTMLATPFLAAMASLWPLRAARAATQMQQTVEHDGVVFTFAEPRPAGRYITGDPFVVGPVEIVSISPAAERTSDLSWVHGEGRRARAIHGAQIDYQRIYPSLQGFDDVIPDRRRHYNFDPARNIDPSFTGQPLRIEKPATVIKAVSLPSEAVGRQLRPCLDRMVFLTVVDAPPLEGAFRPSAEPGAKQARWREADVDVSIFPRLPKPVTVEYDWDVEALLDRNIRPHWNEYGRYDSTRQMMAKRNQWNYGREHAYETAYLALAACHDLPEAKRRALRIALIQQGLDLFEMIEAGQRIKASDGNAIGRALPLVAAAAAIGDPRLREAADGQNFAASEHGQFFYVGNDVIGRPRVRKDRARGPYTESMRGIPDFGGQHRDMDGSLLQPERSGSHYGMSYRNIVSNPLIAAGAAAHVIRGGVETWNQPALFDYLDRWYRIERYRLSGDTDRLHYGNGPGPLPYAYWTAWRSSGSRPVYKAPPEPMYDDSLEKDLGILVQRGAPLLRADVGAFDFHPLMNPFRDSLLDRESVFDLRISLDGETWKVLENVGGGGRRLEGLQRRTRHYVQMRQRHPEHGAGPWSFDWFWWREGARYEGRKAPDGRNWEEAEPLGDAPTMLRWLSETYRRQAPAVQVRRADKGRKPGPWKTPGWLFRDLDYDVPDEILRNTPHIPFVVTL